MTINRTLLMLLISNALASIGTGVAMIGIPWLLIKQSDGGAFFSFLAMIVNITLFLATPFLGPIIDRASRKSLMIILRAAFLVGLSIIYLLQITDTTNGSNIPLVIYYCLGASFYAINIPLRSAFVQELFQVRQYTSINSILEIESQVAAVLTGLLAIFLIESYGLNSLIYLNFTCYLIAIICICIIKAKPRSKNIASSSNLLKPLIEGVHIALSNRSLAYMLMAASMPYVVIILFTILHPVALAQLPNATSSTYALVELLFALGSILAGITLGWLAGRSHSSIFMLKVSLISFAVIASLQAIFPTYWGFIILAGAFGYGNSIVRILRQTILMDCFSENEIGRISALLQSYIMFMRAVTIYAITIIITRTGVNDAVLFTGILACISGFIFIVVSRKENITPSANFT